MALTDKLDNSQDEWLRLPKAAQHLSNISGKAFSEADVLEEALKGRLKISVRFVNPVEAIPVKSVPSEEWINEEFPVVATYRSAEVMNPCEVMTFGFNADRGIFYRSDSNEHIKDVWDLPMIGNEKSRVEDEYQKLTDKGAVMLDCNAAPLCTLVENPKGQMYMLQEFIGPTPFKTPEGEGMTDGAYFPAHCLPDDSVLVIRPSALDDLLEHFEKKQISKKAKKMTVPRPKWFTVDQLAEEWRVSAWKVRHFIETGQLIASERFSSKLDGADVFISLSLGGGFDANKDEMSYTEFHDDLREEFTDGEKQYYIMLEEVERFEEEHGLVVDFFQEGKTRLEEAQGQKPLVKAPSCHNSELLSLSSVQDEPCNSTPPTQEAFPGDPGEPALIGWRVIAPHMGLTVARNGKKPKGMNRHIETGFFPLMEMPITGKPYTYLSQIKKYYAQIQKK